MDCSPLGSSDHGILQARIRERVAMPSSRDLPDPGIEPVSPVLQADFFYHKATGEALKTFYSPQILLSLLCP